MKALVYTATRTLELREIGQPQPAAGEVLLRVGCAGICGSDLEGYAGQEGRRVPPLIMGHEFGGTVVAIGDGVTGLRAGLRVTVNPMITCGACEPCRSGRSNLCPQRKVIGIHRPGAFAESVAVPAACCHALPDGISDLMASLVEPVACGVHAVRVAGNPRGGNILVLGAGTIGLMTAMVAKAAGGARVLMTDVADSRLEVARRLVADEVVNPKRQDVAQAARDFTAGAMFDLCFDAAGTTATRKQTVDLLRPGGAAVWIGLHSYDAAISAREIVLWEKTIRGSYGYDAGDFREAIRLCAAGAIKTEGWIRTDPLADGPRLFEELLGSASGSVKAVLAP